MTRLAVSRVIHSVVLDGGREEETGLGCCCLRLAASARAFADGRDPRVNA